MADRVPHFYCDTCSNVFYSEKFKKIMYEFGPTERALLQIEKELPNCICGGQFRVEANPKCPHCKKDLPMPKNRLEKFIYPYVVIVKGSYFLQPADEEGKL
ncbi:MAG: hypothetical protein ACOYY3_07185 [Chloroflexota bacterium]